ncbi:protealysin inhibitor emfourin [Streptomyces sp. HB2AG]|uniref:protealysin inhibitor emfourin n=1 Tax=Streptomyces sp. HB2AG TaxID=2983400 RepID=UPI0022AB19E8|nr:protealysin inhibitor emfourin [Streptomyces sp. HB2AG]MCZ2523102.1 hypothetical protein [Streptomyces sp. HB2AG]
MRIEVVRSGGFAGRTRRAAVETDGRPDAPEWHALADRALAAAPPPGSGGGVPDGFHYGISAGGRTAHWADPYLTEEQAELVERVLAEGG